MKKIKQLMMSLALVAGLGFAALPAPALAINVFEEACTGASDSAVCSDVNNDEAGNLVNTIVNVMLYILGAIAVIMIIVGGIMYTTSGGDAGNIKKAKDTILYSVIGLVVAILAFTIINFVVGAFA